MTQVKPEQAARGQSPEQPEPYDKTKRFAEPATSLLVAFSLLVALGLFSVAKVFRMLSP